MLKENLNLEHSRFQFSSWKILNLEYSRFSFSKKSGVTKVWANIQKFSLIPYFNYSMATLKIWSTPHFIFPLAKLYIWTAPDFHFHQNLSQHSKYPIWLTPDFHFSKGNVKIWSSPDFCKRRKSGVLKISREKF